MIVKKFILFLFISFTLTNSLNAKASICGSAMTKMAEANSEDWGKVPPSLKPLIAANLAMLIGVESVRGLAGWEHAFSSQFLVNTPIDMIITSFAHLIATGRAPKSLQDLTSGRRGYVARAATNTVINTAVILAMWHLAAFKLNASITVNESLSALGLCTGFYFGIQFVKNKLFIELPRILDKRLLEKMKADIGPELTSLVQTARERSAVIEIDQNQVDLLFVSALDQLIVGNKKKEIWKILDEIEKTSNPELRQNLLQKIDLGPPFSLEQSLEIHRTLKKRYWRNKVLVRAGAVADQTIGVVLAGGILLRGLTQTALQN